MRNSNVMAIAPTATISNICGVSQSIEPTYQQPVREVEHVRRVHRRRTRTSSRDLKARGLWDEVMVSDLKYLDGVLGRIERVPADLQRAVRDRVRDRPDVAGEGGVAAAEVDRPGAVAEPLHGRAGGRDAGRAVPARRGDMASRRRTTCVRQSATHVEKSTLRGTDGTELERRSPRRALRSLEPDLRAPCRCAACRRAPTRPTRESAAEPTPDGPTGSTSSPPSAASA